MPKIISKAIASGSGLASLGGDGTPVYTTSQSVRASSEVNEESTPDIISKTANCKVCKRFKKV